MATVSSLEVNLARRATIGDIPKRTAAKYPDRTALVWQDKKITFQELNENSCRFANALLKAGIRKGDRIAFISRNCLQYIYAWLGMAKIGGIITPLNYMLKPAEIEYIINHAEPRFFFVEDNLIPQVQEAAVKLKSVEKFGYIPISGGAKPEGWLNIDDFLSPAWGAAEPPRDVAATITWTLPVQGPDARIGLLAAARTWDGSAFGFDNARLLEALQRGLGPALARLSEAAEVPRPELAEETPPVLSATR